MNNKLSMESMTQMLTCC